MAVWRHLVAARAGRGSNFDLNVFSVMKRKQEVVIHREAIAHSFAPPTRTWPRPSIRSTCVCVVRTAALLVFLQFNLIKLDSSAGTVSIDVSLFSFFLKSVCESSKKLN